MKYIYLLLTFILISQISAQPASRYIGVSASSYLRDKEQHKYSPYNIFDGNPSTAWVEGVDGDGINESITIDLGPGEYLQGAQELIVEISNGYQKSDKAYENNGIPTKVELELSYGDEPVAVKILTLPVAEVPLEESESGATVSCTYGSTTFDNLENTTKKIKLTIKILNVKTGKKWKDSAISEVKTHFVGANPANVAQFFKDLCVHYATKGKETIDNTTNCLELMKDLKAYNKYKAEYDCKDFLSKSKPIFFVRSAYCVDAFYDNDCDGEDGYYQRFFLSGQGDWRPLGIVIYRTCNGC